jgi:hypothetical protein
MFIIQVDFRGYFMHSKKIFLVSFFIAIYFFTISLTASSSKHIQDNDVIASINNEYTFTFSDLRQYVFDWSYNKKYRNIKEGYSAALEAMITNQLKRIDFFARGLNKDEKLIQGIHRIIKEEINIEYYNTQYLSKYTNDDYAKKIYGIIDRQVTYQRILLRWLPNYSKTQKDSVQKKAMDIRDEITNGKDFRQLVKQYSQDSISINTNGFVPPVGWEQCLSDPMGEAIFNLKSGDIRVLNALEGLFIIRVFEVKKLTVEPFEQIKTELKSKLKNIYLDKSLAEFQKDKEKSVDESSIKWNNEAIIKLIKWSEIPDFYLNIYQDTLQNAISKNNFIILTYQDGQIDLKDYLNLLNNIVIPRFGNTIKVDDIKSYIIEALRTVKVIEKAEKLGIEDKLFNIKTNNPVLKSQIVLLYNQAVIDSQIPKPTDEILHKFYNERKDSLYYQFHKVNVYTMIFPDENQAQEVMQKIKAGTPFEKMSGKYLVKTFILEHDGKIKSYLSNEEPFLGETAFKLNLNETTGPVKYHDPEKGEQYAVIKCINIRPEKQLSFDDVKKTIVADYSNYNREIMMKKVRDQLWKKYDVEIFEDVISKKINLEK